MSPKLENDLPRFLLRASPRWRVDYDYLDERGVLRERVVPFATEVDARRFVEFLSHVSSVRSAKVVETRDDPLAADQTPEPTDD